MKEQQLSQRKEWNKMVRQMFVINSVYLITLLSYHWIMFTCHCGETTSEANYNSDMRVHVALSSLDKHHNTLWVLPAPQQCLHVLGGSCWCSGPGYKPPYWLRCFYVQFARSACASPNVAECWSDALTLKITNSFTCSKVMINCSLTFVLILNNNFQIFASVFIANIEL